MIQNLPVIPIFIPLIVAALLILIKDIKLQKIISILSLIITLLFTLIMIIYITKEGPIVLEMGQWPAPFGIVLVSDLASSFLVFTSTLITLIVLVYAFPSIGRNRENIFFYSGIQFLLVGVNGAFTTGDIFNLYVMYEVLLMASYLLIVIGSRQQQLKASISYILINVFGGTVFVIALAYLYTVVGTLNMAHISQTIKILNQPSIINIIGIVFITVFALKGALFPLFVWMPKAYSAPPFAISALFGALLTKVGIFSILRFYSLMFPIDHHFIQKLLLYIALISIIVGCIGAVAHYNMKQILIYNIIIAVGVITVGIALMTTDSIIGSLFYTIHDMLVKALLFLLIGSIIYITKKPSMYYMRGLIHQYPLLGWLFFIATLCISGIPPFSGFYGKLLIIRAAFATQHHYAAIIILLSSLVVLYSMIKIFINVFWGEQPMEHEKINIKSLLLPIILLTVTIIIFSISANTLYPYLDIASQYITSPDKYINVVLQGGQ